MSHILVIDDDASVLQLVKRILEKDYHQISLQPDSRSVPEMDFSKYDMILMDIMMPGLDGYELCSRIRSIVDCPIIFLTAKTMEMDIVKGLGTGADDYIVKPFGAEELRARVAAHLRRDSREKKNAVTVSGILFHLNAKRMEVGDFVLPLTKSEYAICEYLALNRGHIFSREQIYTAVFGYDGDSDSAAIATHMKNIRAKLAVFCLAPIETVWGVGYKWV